MGMATRYYERLLGLPADVVNPDYYQLLGLARDSPIDEEQLVDVLAERLDRLESAKPDERSIVQHLTRELQRARATLLDPRGCAGHLEEMKKRRLREVPKYVAALLDGDRALSDGAERALLERAPAWDMTASELTRAIDRALLTLQAKRTKRPEASAGAEARVLDVIHKVADDQLRVDAGLTANAEATPRRRKREPIESVPETARAASGRANASVGAAEGKVDEEKDPTDAEAVHWSPTRAPAAPQPPPSSPSSTHSHGSSTPWAPVGASLEAERSGARRWQRTFLALGVLAAAFIMGDLAAAFWPAEATWLDVRTAPARARLWASPSFARVALGGAAAALAMFGIMVWLAGRAARRPFAIPLALLALPLAYAGLVPVGHERAVLLERDALARDRDTLVLQTRAVSTLRDAAALRESSALAAVTTLSVARSHLEQQLVDRDQQLAERERQLAERSERVTRVERLLRREAETARRLKAETAALQAEIATIRSASDAASPVAAPTSPTARRSPPQ